MARFDAILSLTATAAVDGWTTAITPVLDQLGYLTAGTDRGASLKALRSGDHQRPALELLLSESSSRSWSVWRWRISSSESMVSGARHTRHAFEELLLMLTQHVGMMAIECRSDRDGPLARSGR